MQGKTRQNLFQNKLRKIHYISIFSHPNHLKMYLILTLFILANEQFEISLIIMEKGNKNIINDNFYLEPSQVKVNGIYNESCKKTCYLDQDLNNVSIIFDKEIESCENMFNGLIDVLEIDLSNFDISLVTNMNSMFKECKNLKKITFGNINTSKVENMNQLFYYCTELTSINLSNLDTSSVSNMNSMFSHCESLLSIDVTNFNTKKVENMCDLFAHCYKLTSINVSNFNTSKVKNMQGMFYGYLKLASLDLSNFNTSLVTNIQGMFAYSNSLIFINLYPFKIRTDANINFTFDNIPSYTKICINDIKTQTLLKVKNNNCSDICFKENIKIDLNENKCIQSCNESQSKYEYNNICYNKCPENTYNINNEYLCLDKKPEGYYFDSYNLIYKKCYSTCKICEEGGNETINNCIKCHDLLYEIEKNNYKNCINKCEEDDVYKYEYKKRCYKICPENTISSKNNKYFCETICPKDKPYEIIKTQECIENCSFNDFKQKKCILNYKDNNNEKGDINSFDIILKNFEKGFTSEDYNTSDIENGKDDIFEHDNFTITLTSTKNQRNSINNKTTIDLGKCEKLLKKENNIPLNETLFLKKIDIIQEGMKIPKIEYDIYGKLNGKNLQKLNKSICQDLEITVSIPIEINENLDKLNISSGYFNNICYAAKSDYGSDIILKDRQKEFIEKNKTICQEDCIFSEYDNTTKKAKCLCKVEESSSSFAEMKINTTKIYQNFINVKKIININIMVCYKELFNKKGVINNIAFYFIMPIFIFHIIVIIIFYHKQKKIINKEIKNIAFSIRNWELVKDDKTQKINKKTKKSCKKTINNRKLKINKDNEDDSKVKEIKILSPNNDNFITNKKLKHNNSNKRNKNKKLKTNNDIEYNNNVFYFMKTKNKENQIIKVNTNKQELIKKIKKTMEYNDNELNNLSYKLALKYDKRTYCQFYISLLKTNHILIFSFCNNNDYNSKIIKIDLLFISYTINYTVNALFFNDNTIHKIYEDEGSFNFIYQLPQIIYSSLISMFLNILLQLLALSEKNIVKFKKKKLKENLDKRMTNLKKILKIKFLLYFIVSSPFLLIFWYYLSIFGAIYRNTQYHLKKDTLIGFGTSLLSPFGKYLLPGLFRIPSLSHTKGKRKNLYKISQLLEII